MEPFTTSVIMLLSSQDPHTWVVESTRLNSSGTGTRSLLIVRFSTTGWSMMFTLETGIRHYRSFFGNLGSFHPPTSYSALMSGTLWLSHFIPYWVGSCIPTTYACSLFNPRPSHRTGAAPLYQSSTTCIKMVSVGRLDSFLASDKHQLARASEHKQNHNASKNKLLSNAQKYPSYWQVFWICPSAQAMARK